MKALFKKIFYYGLYIVTALVACLCSLFLVLNFLNPAFSQTEEEPAKKPGFGAIFKTIAKEVKAVVAPMGQKSQNPDKASQPATPPPPSNYENPEELNGRAIDTSATGPQGASNSAQPSSAQNAGSPALQNTGNPASPQAGQALPKAQALPDSALNPQAKGASQPATASATKASTANPVNPAQSASSAQNAGSPVLQNTGNPASAQAGQALPKAQALPDSALNPQATGASSPVSPTKASTANPANSAQPAGSAQNPGSSVLQNPGNPSSIQAGQVLPKAQALPDSALNPQATGSSSPVTTAPTKASTTNPGNLLFLVRPKILKLQDLLNLRQYHQQKLLLQIQQILLFLVRLKMREVRLYKIRQIPPQLKPQKLFLLVPLSPVRFKAFKLQVLLRQLLILLSPVWLKILQRQLLQVRSDR